MRDALVLLLFALLVGGAILAGGRKAEGDAPGPGRTQEPPDTDTGTAAPPAAAAESGIPSIGSVQVLNGCGVDLAGVEMADFLRSRGFDVKNVDNAPTWNYPVTIVVARTGDMRNARRVAAALATDKVVMLRTGEEQYDVVVYIGADYQERIR
jgi:hypothetical protein